MNNKMLTTEELLELSAVELFNYFSLHPRRFSEGLCEFLNPKYSTLLELFKPTKENYNNFVEHVFYEGDLDQPNVNFEYRYWGSDNWTKKEKSTYGEVPIHEFGETRKNVLLFIAAMKEEI